MSILNKLNNAGFNPTKATPIQNQARPATPAQMQWYLTLCEEKQQPVLEGYDLLDSASMSREIEKLKAMRKPMPASTRQVEYLTEMYEDLGIPTPAGLSSISFDKASDLIKTMKVLHEKKMAERPSKKQLELLTQMLYCPDVNEAELMAMPMEWIDELCHLQDDLKALYHVQDAELMKAVKEKAGSKVIEKLKADFDRKIKANQESQLSLRQQIESFEANFSLDSLKKTVVSEFIAKYNQPYREWMQTRASESQRSLINDLLKRNGQDEMEYAQLIQYDRAQASKVIETLRTGKVPTFTTKEHEYRRRAESVAQAHLYFQEELEALIHRLCAMANFSPDDAKDLLNRKDEDFDSHMQDLCLMAAVLNGNDTVIDCLAELFDEEEISNIMGI